jgi:hypothetical protein
MSKPFVFDLTSRIAELSGELPSSLIDTPCANSGQKEVKEKRRKIEYTMNAISLFINK